MPDLTDPLAIRQSLESQTGLQDLTAKEQDVSQRLAKARQTSREQQTALENLPQALNLIRGEQAEARRLSSAEIQTLVDQQAIAQTARLAAEQRVDTLFNIVNQDRTRTLDLAYEYPGADIKLGDTPEQIQTKLKSYQREQEKKEKKEAEEERSRQYKDMLKEQLLGMGSSVRGLSTNELERKLKKKNKAAYERAKKFEDMQMTNKNLENMKLQKVIDEYGGGRSFDPSTYFVKGGEVIKDEFGNGISQAQGIGASPSYTASGFNDPLSPFINK
jgi:hypothetical protein